LKFFVNLGEFSFTEDFVSEVNEGEVAFC